MKSIRYSAAKTGLLFLLFVLCIYSLPNYIDSSVMEYPEILGLWADALGM